MKKYYLVILISNVISFISFAQPYQPFPMSNTRWSEEGEYSNLGGVWDTSHTYYGYSYILAGDTLIDGKHYTLLKGQDTWSYITIYASLSVIDTMYKINPLLQAFGAIREDSFKKVWFKKLSLNSDIQLSCFSTYFLPVDTEILLYDFNLQVGDSIHWTSLWMDTFKHILAIDSIQFDDGIWRKRYRMWPFGEYWIEGIGSTLGLFGFPTVNPYCWLNCFWNNGQYDIIKPQSGHVVCDSLISVGISQIPKPNLTFSLTPNLATTQLQIYLTTSTQPQHLKLINTLGQTIQQQTFSTNQLQLDISTLPSGVYFIELQNEIN